MEVLDLEMGIGMVIGTDFSLIEEVMVILEEVITLIGLISFPGGC